MVERRETGLLRHSAALPCPRWRHCSRRATRSPWSSRSPTAPWAALSSSPRRPSSRPRWPLALPSRSRKRFATTRSFARSLRPLRRRPLSWWPTGASFRRGCWRCRGSAASICTLRCCRSIAAPRPSSGPWPWATPSPATRRCCSKKASTPGRFCCSRPSRSRPDQTAADLFRRAGQGGRAAGGGDAGRPGRRNHPAQAAEPRAGHACSAARPRRRAHGLCRAHGARNSTIAGAAFSPGPARSPRSTARS